MSRKLTMTFDPNTISHLGIKMYSQVPNGLAELIANAYDADASKVQVKLYDKDEMKIVVEDDGCGMSLEEINSKFLRIGRNRREGAENIKSPKGRMVSGKKGLGKLALFGLGYRITIQTKTINKTPIKFSLDWDSLKKTEGDYHPKIIKKIEKQKNHGTIITISNLTRTSPFNQKQIANSLAKLFCYFDASFIVSVKKQREKPIILTNKSKFDSLGSDTQITWADIPSLDFNSNYEHRKDITGTIIATKKPLKSGLRGITLYANGRMVNLPTFFGDSESSHFYSYITGILNIDFIDDPSGENDLISTNRKSLDWEASASIKLEEYLTELEKIIQIKWRAERKALRIEGIKKIGIDTEFWLKSLPKDKKQTIEKILSDTSNDNDTISIEKVIRGLHEIVPEYAAWHWRYLHSDIKNNKMINDLYRDGYYYQALTEALKLYIAHVREISKSTEKSDYNLMDKVFKKDKDVGKIQLTKKKTDTERNIENGHADLSRGIVAGFRNPLAHDSTSKLKKNKLITEEDCLNILSLLSHLFSRLDRRVSPPLKP